MSENSPLLSDRLKDVALMDNIVHTKQLSKYPSSTLIAARFFKVFIWIVVALAVYGLISNFLVGSMSAESSTTKVAALMLPKVVFCPVWGQEGMNLRLQSASVGNMMTTDFPEWKQVEALAQPCEAFEHYKFEDQFLGLVVKPRLVTAKGLHEVDTMGCVCVTADMLLAGRDVGKDFVRIVFSAAFTEDTSKKLAIGFSAGNNEYPADFSYVDLNKRSIGDITLEETEYGASPFGGGTVLSQYAFNLKTSYPVVPAQQVRGGESEVVLSFGSYMISTTSAFSSKFSFWALLYLLSLLLAVLAGLALFNLIFPEVQDPEDPKKLEPAWFIQSTCGKCCSCCRRKKTRTDM